MHSYSGQNKQMSSRSGITLLELVIVISILGILAILTIPNMGQWSARRELNRASREMLGNFQLARSQAITLGRNVVIQIDVANDWYQVQDSTGNVVVPQVTMPNGIDIVNALNFPLSATVNTAGLNPRGFSTLNNNGSVVIRADNLTAPNNTRTIVLTTGGSVSIQ